MQPEPSLKMQNMPSLKIGIHGGRDRVGGRVLQAISRLGHQRKSGGFIGEEGRISASDAKVSSLKCLPLQEIKPGMLWAIKGVYERQAVCVGLRCLDELWCGNGLFDFPSGKKALMKEGLFRDVFALKRSFQSIPKNDLAAAQPDLQRLSLVQALRLRVILLDSASQHSSAGLGFAESLDRVLFELLGGRLTGSTLQASKADLVKIGSEAVMMVAASRVISRSHWWSWWPALSSGEQRVFFDARTFSVSTTFPATCVLEFANFSKPDFNDAAGGSQWMDWQIKTMFKESELSKVPPRRGKVGIAGLVSPEVLKDGRERLNKRV